MSWLGANGQSEKEFLLLRCGVAPCFKLGSYHYHRFGVGLWVYAIVHEAWHHSCESFCGVGLGDSGNLARRRKDNPSIRSACLEHTLLAIIRNGERDKNSCQSTNTFARIA